MTPEENRIAEARVERRMNRMVVTVTVVGLSAFFAVGFWHGLTYNPFVEFAGVFLLASLYFWWFIFSVVGSILATFFGGGLRTTVICMAAALLLAVPLFMFGAWFSGPMNPKVG